MIDKKKKAAVAAVMHYLACENNQLSEEAQEAVAEARQDSAPSPGVQPWALSGRQAQMQMRTMVQMKAFH